VKEDELKTWEECFYELGDKFIERNSYLMYLLGESRISFFEVKTQFEKMSPDVQESIREGGRKLVVEITKIEEEPFKKSRPVPRKITKRKAPQPIPNED
jgi:hypothetical protein